MKGPVDLYLPSNEITFKIKRVAEVAKEVCKPWQHRSDERLLQVSMTSFASFDRRLLALRFLSTNMAC